MKIKYTKLNLILITITCLTMLACDNEDFTGHSRLKPTSPVISIVLPTQAELDDPSVTDFEIEISMSVAQIVDVAVHSLRVGGDAIAHDDFDIEDRIIIPSGSTTGKFNLHLLSDEMIDGPLTVILQIGDPRTANAEITPIQFTIDRN